VLALGCSPSNTLEGSMIELTGPLTFNQVTVKLAQNQLVVSYLELDDGGGQSMPFQLTVDSPDGGFQANSHILVSGLTPDAGPDAGTTDGGDADGGEDVSDAGEVVFAQASRSVPNDTHAFSPIDRGHVNLTQQPVVGQPASGDFFVVFTYQTDGTLGAGRTVFGNFSATVTQ